MKNWKIQFRQIFGTERPIIGMIHLRPLPGAPHYDPRTGMNAIIHAAMEDAGRLIEGGIDGIQIENQWDRPFLKADQIGFETVAAITAVVTHLKTRFDVPMGINVHLNGVRQALAVAVATGCQWVRAFELANAYISSAGIMEAAGPQALRYRSFLKADTRVLIFGDFHVKHGSHQIIADRSLEEQAEDVQTALADGLIVTGHKTGSAPTREDVEWIKQVVQIPVLIGSGLSLDNLEALYPLVDGAIVGSNFKIDENLRNPVDLQRVSRFMEKVKIIRRA